MEHLEKGRVRENKQVLPCPDKAYASSGTKLDATWKTERPAEVLEAI